MSSGVSHLFAGNETFRQSVSSVLQFRLAKNQFNHLLLAFSKVKRHNLDAFVHKSIQTIVSLNFYRQTLLPYHYDNQYRAHVSSEVPLRFLTFDYPSDERAALFQDQVLFGDAILYTPILITGIFATLILTLSIFILDRNQSFNHHFFRSTNDSPMI